MATSIWKKLADIAGYSTIGNSWNSMVNGDFWHGLYLNTLPGFFTDYVKNIKNWNNDSSESSANSGVSVDNNSQSNTLSINSDGSSNYSNIINATDLSSLSGLVPFLAEWLLGANPEVSRMWNTAEAQKERTWQTDMSNTAYQRSVADMTAAGINPILAYSQGGASSGVGAVASSTPSSASSVGPILSGINSIVDTVLSKDMKSDEQAHKAAMDALKYQDSHSATTASNNYYKSLTKLNKMTLSEAKRKNNSKIGF